MLLSPSLTPKLARGNQQIANLTKDALEFESKRVIVTANDIIDTSNFVIGNTIVQKMQM